MFRKLYRAPSMAAQCADEIRTAILTGELRAGDKLMPERELADAMGVNRVTLRNALGQLQAAGLIRAKQGSGYTVERFRDCGGPELLPAIVRVRRDDPEQRIELVADLLLARRHLAHAALSKIASMDQVELEGSVLAFQRLEDACERGDIQAIAEADIGVVAAILDATGSPVFRLALNPVAAALDELPELREFIYREPDSNVQGYRVLLGWMSVREPDGVPMLVAMLEQRDRETVALMREEMEDE
ncbi:MAG: GntR family transcriptional regulator [Deltaproteobacteria bacterium]|nr:GntR family transcriptional regulator [Deltaproteobacteria bacterium]